MLKPNNNKSEFFVAISSYFKRTMPDLALRIGDNVINPSKNIRNSGIMFDDVMSMSTKVTNLSRSIIYHLRNITRIHRFMDSDTCTNVVRSLVLSRLEYSNALLLGVNKSHLSRLQHLQIGRQSGGSVCVCGCVCVWGGGGVWGCVWVCVCVCVPPNMIMQLLISVDFIGCL